MLTIFLGALIPAFLYSSLFYFMDKNREPVKEVARAFRLGILSVFVLILIHMIKPMYIPLQSGKLTNSLMMSFYEAAIPEELSKYVVFLAGVYFRHEFDEWYDGLFYGVMIGLGFAFLENIKYFLSYDPHERMTIILWRSILSMPTHALLGAVMGYFIGKAKFTLDERMIPLLFILALLLPIIIHGLYDFALFYLEINWIVIPIVLLLWRRAIKMKTVTQETKIF